MITLEQAHGARGPGRGKKKDNVSALKRFFALGDSEGRNVPLSIPRRGGGPGGWGIIWDKKMSELLKRRKRKVEGKWKFEGTQVHRSFLIIFSLS